MQYNIDIPCLIVSSTGEFIRSISFQVANRQWGRNTGNILQRNLQLCLFNIAVLSPFGLIFIIPHIFLSHSLKRKLVI